MTFTLGSLFDGIGGWQLAAVHAGVRPVWSSEIEPFPCAVTSKHFPNTVQLGDITKLDGAELLPVDIICAGSPCQNLSVAGKQEGLKGARSGLFLRAVDIVRRMRFATGGQYPRFFVWENVPGAFSSNRGMDFQAVLEEIGESAVPMPEGNRWASAGLVQFPGAEIAWRVLDAQYWGVPQRRRRIFLVADFRGRSAGEILFERESVPWDSAPSGKAREGAAAGIESGANGASVVRMRAGKPGGGKGALVSRERSLTLAANTNDQVLFTGNCLMPWDCQAKRIYKQDGVFPCLQSTESNGEKPGSVYVPDKARSLTARNDGSPCTTLNARMGTGGNQVPAIANNKSIRRLTPTECERLQGLPDGYTLIDDKTCSDTARYKALGNGMAQPVANWVIKRIKEVVDGDGILEKGAD